MQFSFYWWHSDYTKALSFFSARSSVLLSVRLYQKINETLCFVMTQKLFRLLEIHLLHSDLSAMIWYSNRVWRSFFQTLCRQNKKSRLNDTEFQELKEFNFFFQMNSIPRSLKISIQTQLQLINIGPQLSAFSNASKHFEQILWRNWCAIASTIESEPMQRQFSCFLLILVRFYSNMQILQFGIFKQTHTHIKKRNGWVPQTLLRTDILTKNLYNNTCESVWMYSDFI